jgi:mono/diheme cytochrome c family protein
MNVRSMSLAAVLFSVWWLGSANADTAGKKDAPPPKWTIVKVELPTVDESFPPGVGSDLASSQCQTCHSAGMVLTQPPLKKDEWRAEITKMRSVYGAPIPEDQVEALAEYLKSIDGRD